MVRLTALACLTTAAVSEEDVILPPLAESSGPERLLVFVPGADVPTENYRATMEAVQKASDGLRLTVVVPAVFSKLCILQCASSSVCVLLKNTVDAAVAKSGFQSSDSKEDTFIGGHSMGSICANNLVTGYSYNYAGLLEFGGYVDKEGASSVAQYPIPVLHLSGELDGGAARPGKLSLFYSQFKDFAREHGEEEALRLKPVHVLPGLDHSDFCPGFFVTAIKDLKSEKSQEEALADIATGSAAFLHLNSPVSSDLQAQAMETMRSMLSFTQDMCEPYLQAFEQERSGEWCVRAQAAVSGLSAADAAKLRVQADVVDFSNFEHGRVQYEENDGGLDVTVVSAFEAAGGFGPADVHGAAKSLDCKMIDATRVAEQLQLDTQLGTACGELNKQAVQAALELLPQSSRQRYEAQGRKFSFVDDTTVFGDIGPLFVQGSIAMTETPAGVDVSALVINNDIKSFIFPGVHYCKFLSPAMAMEWMMTDILKPFPYNLTMEVLV